MFTLAEVNYPTQNADWGDFDNDGDLDLFVGNESDPTFEAPSQLFRNEGDGTFTEIAKEAGVENLRYAKGSAWGDYDGDDLPDLYVSNMGSANRLYRNNGDGTFTDVTAEAGVGDQGYGMGASAADYDGDSDQDLYVLNYGPNVMYRNNGDGTFTDVTEETGLADPLWSVSAPWLSCVRQSADVDASSAAASFMGPDVA